MSKNLENPTYEQLMEAAKKGLEVTYEFTVEENLQLHQNGVDDMVFARNDLGQAQIIAREGKLREEVSSVVIHDWE